MIIVDPVALGDAACMRPSPKWVYDRTGTLVEVPPDTLAVTYDPSDLSAAPFAVVDLEPATNAIRHSQNFSNSVWFKARTFIESNATIAPDGSQTGDRLYEDSTPSNSHYMGQAISADTAQTHTKSLFVKAAEKSEVRLETYAEPSTATRANVSFNMLTGEFYAAQVNGGATQSYWAQELPNGWWRLFHTVHLGDSNPNMNYRVVLLDNGSSVYSGDGRSGIYVWGAQNVAGENRFSYIPTTDAAVTRAADVIGPTAGLIYSNVPMVEPPYDLAVTYAKGALVRDPVTHGVYQSLIDANKGKSLTDEASWNSRGKTNRWAMLDEYNNTQTTNPEEIVIVLSPQSICEGLFLGNTDADEIELVVVDQSEGKVYSEVTSLVTASGSSSYYDWCFRPADRADYYFTVAMPPYASALVTVVLRKPGGVAKCGMAVIGLVDDFGPSLYGLSASGKDFSSTTFNFDGTSKTQFRDYAKQMNVDVQVNNGEIDYIQRKLFQLRQRPIVWIGGPYGATAVFGRYVSFDIVIPGLLKSDMSLQIEGSV